MWLTVFIYSLSGLLLGLSYPNQLSEVGIIYLLPVSMIAYFHAYFSKGSMSLHTVGYLIFSLIFYALTFSWIPQTLINFGDLPQIAALLIGLLFSPFILPAFGIILLCKLICGIKPPFIYLLFLVSEIFLPALFPVWLGHSALSFPYMLYFPQVFGASLYSYLLLTPSMIKEMKCRYQKILLLTLCMILFIIDSMLGSTIKKTANNPFTVTILQANVGNFLKLSAESGELNSLQSVYEKFKQLAQKSNPLKSDLFILPETALPDIFNSEIGNQSLLNSPYMREFLSQQQEPVLFGGYDIGHLNKSANGIKSIYNSAFLYSKNLPLEFYHKKILLPFGETLPFGVLNEKIATWIPEVSLFSEGADAKIFTLKNTRFITPICYEILDRNYMRHLTTTLRPNLIINLTNDSWYGISSEPYQHLFLARWRSLELGLPIIRSTNTGITTTIGKDGVVQHSVLGINTEGSLQATITTENTPPLTLYAQWGDLTILLFYLLVFGLLLPFKTLSHKIMQAKNTH